MSLFSDRIALRLAVAFVWLFTGLAVLHPYYREVGAYYLVERLGLPELLMYVTCVLEVLLGAAILFLRPRPWLTFLQIAAILVFTVLLAVDHPRLLVHPFGILSKNVCLIALIGCQLDFERRGWTPASIWLLRAGMAFIWIWEGFMACVLFQDQTLLDILTKTGLPLGNPPRALWLAGHAQAAGGIAALILRGRALQLLLAAQVFGLLVITAVVTWYDAPLWFHPFGPVTKNIPIVIGTALAIRHAPAGNS